MIFKNLLCVLLLVTSGSLLYWGNPLLGELGKGLMLISVVAFTAFTQQNLAKKLADHSNLPSVNQEKPEAIQMTNRKVA